VAEQDRLLAEAADVVFCTSEALCEDKRRVNDNVHLVPNGADYELFASASEVSAPPDDLTRIQRPILGFIGTLNVKVDYQLLRGVAVRNPEWSIVLIGTDNTYSPAQREALRELLRCKNVTWLGFRPLADLPAYLNGFDVCAIPNKLNEYTQFVYPIKLHEYLAAGKPIVATDMPSLRPYRSVVQIARSVSDWTEQLNMARERERVDAGWRQRRHAVARQNTWDLRARQIQAALTRALEMRS
jgi:glycosyltransferase involved in cell wall biosynthesis